jgi:hypothetical protein
MTFRDLTLDTLEDIVFEGPQVAEFADLMAKVPMLSQLTPEQITRIRTATPIVGRRNGTDRGRDWSYEFPTPDAAS